MAAKFIFVALVLFLVLNLGYGLALIDVFVMGVLLTGILYLLGDLVILPRTVNSTDNSLTSNLMAAVVDFGLVLGSVWIIGRYFISPLIPWFTAAFISAAVIALGEMLFHRYLRETTIGKRQY